VPGTPPRSCMELLVRAGVTRDAQAAHNKTKHVRFDPFLMIRADVRRRINSASQTLYAAKYNSPTIELSLQALG
jgi:hypothetical protein